MKINLKNPLFIFGVGALLVAGSFLGATNAAGTPTREKVEFKTVQIGVELQEDISTDSEESNYVKVDGDGALVLKSLDAVKDGSEIMEPGNLYPERVRVVNNSPTDGEAPEYVRVVVRKYWIDDSGNKDTRIDPSVIQLLATDDWGGVASPSGEEVIYYCKKPINKGESSQVIESVSFEKDIEKYLYLMKATQTTTRTDTEEGIIIESFRTYGGQKFVVEMKVDAVQAHGAEQAMLGAWGVNAKFEGDILKSIDGKTL